MIQKSFQITPEELPEKEVWFAMGYRDSVPEARIRDYVLGLRDRLVPQATLRYMYQVVEAEKLSPRSVRMGGETFTPEGIICSYLEGMTHALLFVGTAGWEYDRAKEALKSEGDIVSDFIADAIGTVLAEMTVARIESDYDDLRTLSMPYSPGYCNWDIREQHILFSLFPEHPCGIVLSDTSLMAPEKSVSGFFAMGKDLQRQPYHCQICKNTKCYKRRKG
ncbi:MAG: 5-methyltetrahydrofolate--homocysteine methyltransferase [Bacteroidales bacterium]|nr:5-methyltetrahydrofolate--homocysteine methyltransferase [Bacteroidales bacterium]